jgi:hypothetical protein
MAPMRNNKSFGEFATENFSLAKDWFDTKAELYKLQLVRAAAKIGGSLLSSLFTLFLFFLFIIFGGVTTACWIGESTGSYARGFGIVTLVLLLVMIVLLRMRKKLFVNPLIRTMLKIATEKKRNNSERNN